MRWRPVVHGLGVLLKVFAAFLMIPVAASLVWDEGAPAVRFGLPAVIARVTTVSFVLTAVTTFLLGALLTSRGKPRFEELRERESLFVVAAAWLVCASIGGLPFLLADATDDPSIAFFESMSGLTTTGFSALALPLEKYAPSIHVWRASLHFAGAMGLVVVAVAIISRLTGGARRMITGEAGGAPAPISTRLSRTARILFGVFVGLNVLFFLLFWVAMHYTGLQLGWKEAAWHALVHAMAGVGTGGYGSLTDSVAGFHSTAVSVVAIGSMAAGGFSFPLYVRMMKGDWASVWRTAEVRFYLALLIAPALWAAVQLRNMGWTWGDAFLHGSFMPISALTGTGFTSTNPGVFPADVRIIILLLMVTGGMVGSTAGAIKVARILLVFRMTLAETRRLLHPHAVSPVWSGGRILREEEQQRVATFFFLYCAFLVGGALVFTALGFDFESALAASAASLGNVGYAWGGFLGGFADPVTPLTRYVGIALMWFGRLEIFAAFVLFVPGTYRD